MVVLQCCGEFFGCRARAAVDQNDQRPAPDPCFIWKLHRREDEARPRLGFEFARVGRFKETRTVEPFILAKSS
jgi:hypothetical protein